MDATGKTFGDRLRELRVAAGLSQTELAGDDISASYISLLEAGKRQPRDEIVHKLARRLGCSTTQLLYGKASDRDERIELEIKFAQLSIDHGDPKTARDRLETLLAEDGIPPRVRASASLLLARACSRTGDFHRGIRVLLPLFELTRQGQGYLLVHELGLLLCGLYLDSGDLRQAIQVGEQAVDAARQQGLARTDEFYRLAATVMSSYVERGDLMHARVWAESLLEEAEESGQSTGQAALYWNLGYLAERQGRISEALALLDKAVARLGEQEGSRDYLRLRNFVAITLLNDDPPQVQKAVEVLDRCFDDATTYGSPDDQAEWHWARSLACLHSGDVEGATANARRAYDLARDSAGIRADALNALSDALEAEGQDEEAAQVRRTALAAVQDMPATRSSALDLREAAERNVDADPLGAMDAFRRALDAAGVRDRSGPVRRQVAALRALIRASSIPGRS